MSYNAKRLYLIFHGRFPSEKAASLFAAKSCEAFADQGLTVTLLAPRRLDREKEDFNKYYGIKNNFQVVYMPVLDLFGIPIFKKVSFAMSFISFSLATFFYLFFKTGREDIVYSNETLPLLTASLLSPTTVYEMHDFPEKKNRLYRTLFKRVDRIISTNRWKKNMLIQKFGMPEDKILYEPNAVDTQKFRPMDKISKRKDLNLPKDKKIVAYAGMFRTMGMTKGLDTAIEALTKLDNAFNLTLIGGGKDDINFYKKRAEDLGVADRVIFTGFVPNHRVPEYLAASDILIAPFPGSDHYNFYMSPMKIFEYMASARPIVATNLVTIREILDDDRSAILIPPEDKDALVEAIQRLASDNTLADALSRNALEKIQSHTWQKRAERIMKHIKNPLR